MNSARIARNNFQKDFSSSTAKSYREKGAVNSPVKYPHATA